MQEQTSLDNLNSLRTWCRPRRNWDPDRPSCCLHTQQPPDGPDLAIYSQEEQFALSVAPSWDSPDILTNQQSPFRLLPETVVTIRNLSTTVSAVNAQVSLYTSVYGIGMPQTLLSAKVIGLAPGQQVALSYPLSQAVLNGPDQHIGVYVRIDHPHDVRRINNAGAQMVSESFTSAEGRTFTVLFPVLNPLPTPQQISLTALPNSVNASIIPATWLFGPLEQILARFSVQIPAGLHGAPGAGVRQDVTIVGRGADNNLLGGLTHVIWVDN